MAKKNENTNIEASKEYYYSRVLEGVTICAHKVLIISKDTSQKDLKILHGYGVDGILKMN